MYPAAPSTDRLAPKDMQVGGFFIPKGTIFWINLFALQNLPSIHDDPTAFKPVLLSLQLMHLTALCTCRGRIRLSVCCGY